MSEKKVLIITYYWPPSGGSGVQRWLKFVKYLPQFGWKPYVFTPANPSFESRDETLLKDIPTEAEIIRFPIWEPYSLFNILSGNKRNPGTFVPGNSKSSVFQKVSVWIRGNFFIPDPRIFWVRPSVKFLSEYLKRNQIATVITTGPPHSIHLIGLKLKKKNPSLNWLADFRDPWSEWGFLDSVRVGTIARWLHRRLEKKVLQNANEVITITPFYVRQLERLSGRKVNLLTNGFDEEDFKNFKVVKSHKFLVRHIGIVNEKCDPRPFMRAVAKWCNEDEKIKQLIRVEFVGAVHPAFKEYVSADETFSLVTVFTGTVPHQALMEIYASSAVLVLVLNGYKDAEGYMPGKLFEYMATGIPVLGVGPVNGDAADLLRNAQQGEMFDGGNQEAIQKYIRKCFDSWLTENKPGGNMNGSKYSRKEITSELVKLLN